MDADDESSDKRSAEERLNDGYDQSEDAMPMRRVKLGGSNGLEVSQCGMGVMSITAFYGDPIPDEDAIELIQKAVESGCTFFDTAEAYVAEHPVTKELLWNEEILGKAVATIGREKVEIGTKFGGQFGGDRSR